MYNIVGKIRYTMSLNKFLKLLYSPRFISFSFANNCGNFANKNCILKMTFKGETTFYHSLFSGADRIK